MFAHNGLDYLLAMLGAWRAGAIAALVNVRYADELDYYLNDCDPVVLIYTGDHLETIDRHRSALASVRRYVCLDGEQPGAISWSEILGCADPPPPDRAEETDIAHLSYTSGSTGRPKGACLAHEPTARATRCIAERLQVQADDVSFGPTALSSSYQLVANVLPALHRRATCWVMSHWEPAAGMTALETTGATILAANPSTLTDALDIARRRGLPASLRLALSGGGPVPPELKRAWRDELGITLAESYGQSELGGFVGLGSPDPLPDARLRACGQPLPDKEVRIVDDDDREVAIGTTGEIVIRGGFMAGYWNRPEQTATALRGGWLHTSDVGTMDAESYVFVRGRVSERLAVGAEHWYPRDIEEVLLRHPNVKEAALVGVPDPALGDRPIAYIVLSNESTVDELVEFAAVELSRDLGPLTVRFVDAMPTTATGKIAKAELRKIAVTS